MNDGTTPSAGAWTRPEHAPGGGEAFVFYAVYAGANVSPTLDVSMERHRTHGLPEGMVLVMNANDSAGYTPADFAIGASPAAYAAAAAAELQFVIAGVVADPSDLLYLRDVVGVVAALVEAGATAVFDLQTLTLFTADEFMGEVFANDAPDGDVHVAVFASVDDVTDRLWLHTRGLRKFGRPDVSLRAVARANKEHAAALVHHAVTKQIRGALLGEGERMDADGFPEGVICFHGGAFDDPDFNNVHVELREPTHPI